MSEMHHSRSMAFKVGWWILVVLAGLSFVNHILGPFLGFASGSAEVLAFIGLAAMNVYALVVLFIGYRRGELWAWLVTWVMVAVYGVLIFLAPDVGRYYLGAAGVMAIAQLLTLAGFRQSDHGVSTGRSEGRSHV